MELEFDKAKRDETLRTRGLDFARCSEIFIAPHFTLEDDRYDYDEPRFITAGSLDNRMVVIVWTQRNEKRRIISLRKANVREKNFFKKYIA